MKLVAILKQDETWGIWNVGDAKWQPRVRSYPTKKDAKVRIAQLELKGVTQ